MDANRNNIWSLYFTLVISFIIFVLFGLIQSLISLFIGVDNFVVYLGLISTVSSILGCGMILFAVVNSKNTIQEYLNLYIPFLYPSVKYFFVFVLLLLGLDYISNVYPELFNDPFAKTVYESADSLLILFLGFVVLGPLFEELLFRGFLFKGLEKTPYINLLEIIISFLITSLIINGLAVIFGGNLWYQTGEFGVLDIVHMGLFLVLYSIIFKKIILLRMFNPIPFGGNGAVIISSLLFSIPHLQYPVVVVLCMVFPMALFLGYVRMKTQSLFLPIIFHSVNNFMTLLLVHLEVY